MNIEQYAFSQLSELVDHLRTQNKNVHLLFAYNGTGKTRLSMDFKHAGKTFNSEGEVEKRDTLYFNAFTEDLFFWDNDLDNETERVLKINQSSKFFEGLSELEMENRIKPLLNRYVDYDFRIDYEQWQVIFSREENIGDEVIAHEHIKVSRGEERLFVWCFFMAIMQLAIDGQEAYEWVKYVYIDDPISSLDDNNAIAAAHHLAQIVKAPENTLKTVISTHHALFFNVLCNEFGNARKLFVKKENEGYILKSTKDSPFIYHVYLIQDLKRAMDEDRLFTYHFNMLRSVLEKTANFHGFSKFSDCIHIDDDDEDDTLYTRVVNIMNHGAYSHFEPIEMLEENKAYFRTIFNGFLNNYKFNDQLFVEQPLQTLT